MIFTWIIFNDEQVTTAMALNNDNARVDPRLLDGSNPGSGINTNDQATGVDAGAVVSLTGMSVQQASLTNDPWYIESNPALVAYCLTLPFVMGDTDIIFAPPT